MKSYNIITFLSLLTPFAYAIDVFQSDIPLTIDTPGTYIVQENLSYKGSEHAIKIKTDNVILNFNGFSLTLSKHKAIGIKVKNVSDFTIENGMISNRHSHGDSIKIVRSNQGLVANTFTTHNRNGLIIKKSSNIQVLDSNFSDAKQSAALVEQSTDITFDNDVFANSNNGLTLSGANENIVLTNSTFPSSTFSNLLVQQVNTMMVENCTFMNIDGDPAKPNLVQFGDADPSQVCNDVVIRNCIIRNRPAHTPVLGNTSPEGLGLYQGSGFLVDACIVDIDNTDQDPAADLSGIHISNPGLGVNGTVSSNVIIRNCIIQGPATDGLYPDVGSSGVLIENNLVSGALKDGIFLAGTSASTVIGNTVINNGTNGIFLGEISPSNAIIDNVVSGNGFNSITSSLPPFGNGISIASDSSSNIVQGNTVFNNAVNGIDDEGTNNQIFGNNAFGNANENFHSATSTIIVSDAGVATLAGANISA